MPFGKPGPAHRHRRALVLAVVSLTWASAVIHVVVAPDHLRAWVPAGAFFIAVAALQLAWGAVIYRRPTRGWLLVGAYGSAALVGLWLVSRTVGAPFGPDPGQPEAVGALDILASLNEVAVIALTALLVAGRTLPTRLAHSSAAALGAASLFAALTISPHAHSSSHSGRSHGAEGHSHGTPGHAHDTPAHPAH